MTDDRTQRAPQDGSRIALGEDYNVEYWTHKLGVSEALLTATVAKVGNGAEAVESYLRRSR